MCGCSTCQSVIARKWANHSLFNNPGMTTTPSRSSSAFCSAVISKGAGVGFRSSQPAGSGTAGSWLLYT